MEKSGSPVGFDEDPSQHRSVLRRCGRAVMSFLRKDIPDEDRVGALRYSAFHGSEVPPAPRPQLVCDIIFVPQSDTAQAVVYPIETAKDSE